MLKDDDKTCGCDNAYVWWKDIDCSLNWRVNIAEEMMCRMGIDAVYFFTSPKGKDVTLKEYTIHEVSEVKNIKLILQDGELPSSNYSLNELDFQFQPDWNVEMSKSSFAAAFGESAMPKGHDFVWVPMLNRMWSVVGAWDEKKDWLMWNARTWHLTLTKYEDNQSVSKDDNLVSATIGDDMKTVESVFGWDVMEEDKESGHFGLEEMRVDGVLDHELTLCDKVLYDSKYYVTKRQWLPAEVESRTWSCRKDVWEYGGTVVLELNVPVDVKNSSDCDSVVMAGERVSWKWKDGIVAVEYGGGEITLYRGESAVVMCGWEDCRSGYRKMLKWVRKCRKDMPIGKVPPTSWWWEVERELNLDDLPRRGPEEDRSLCEAVCGNTGVGIGFIKYLSRAFNSADIKSRSLLRYAPSDRRVEVWETWRDTF